MPAGGSATTGSDVARRVARWSAQLESFLSTHAFEVLFVTVYALANIFQFLWGAFDEYHYPKHVDNNRSTLFKILIATARGAGYTLNLNCALIILLACRLVLTSLRETPMHNVLPLDRAFPDAHVIVGVMIAIGVVIHVPFHFAWIINFNEWGSLKLWSISMTVAVGLPLFAIFVGMLITALPWFRKNHFHIFYVAHILGASLFFPLLLLHGMYNEVPETYKWVLGPLILYAIDRIVRRFKISTASLNLSGANAINRAGNVIEVRVPKPFGYRAGQYAEIAVPDLGREWHPFTIASAPHESEMAFYIKPGGDWTTKLRAAFDARHEDPALPPLAVRVRGPFGAPAQHTDAYKRVVLVSGGIGATPFAAIAKHLHFRATQEPKYGKGKGEKSVQEKFPEAEHKIAKTLSHLYRLGGTGFVPDSSAVKVEAGVQIAEALTLAATPRLPDRDMGEPEPALSESDFSSAPTPSPRGRSSGGRGYCVQNISSDESSSSSDDGRSSLGKEKDMLKVPGSLNVVRGTSARVLSFLHTTRVGVALMLTLIVRASLVVIVSIYNIGNFGFTQSSMSTAAYWAVGTETVLSALMTAVMGLTIGLEIFFLRSRYFSRVARCVDLLFFIPVSLTTTLLSALSWAETDVRGALTLWHFGILLPLLAGLLAHRLYRSIGSRDLLATHDSYILKREAPDVDFVWTTPKAADDQWLLDELAPLEDGSALRLHRYVTREEIADVQDVESAGHIATKSGRPHWGKVFGEVAAGAPSGSDVGVFFCGPPAMGDAIRKAMRAAEVQSNLRGAYLARMPDWQLIHELALNTRSDVDAVRGVGSNVRFVFREENF